MSNRIKNVLGVMIAKKNSRRLPHKNRLSFHGKPMYQWNLRKMISIFDSVVFDSDCTEMLSVAKEMGAIPHRRAENLLGHDVPSVPIFQSIISDFPSFSFLINVQANSPNVASQVIRHAGIVGKEIDAQEILTVYSDLTINGSVWGFSRERLENYENFYVHHPDVLLLDDSIDIHTQAEFDEALDGSTS